MDSKFAHVCVCARIRAAHLLLEQMKLQDDLNNNMISSYADTLRMLPGFVVLISQQFMQCFAAAAAFPGTPTQILDPLQANPFAIAFDTHVVALSLPLSIVAN